MNGNKNISSFHLVDFTEHSTISEAKGLSMNVKP